MDILTQVKAIEPIIIGHRRTIHQHPELGFKEFETNKYICGVLDSLQIPYKIVCNTGIVATIGDIDKYKNKCIAFRAELDALPIEEETGLPYCSVNSGISHACGHDLHIAMLLGAAEILQHNVAELQGCVKLLFQPGEEILPGGAKQMIEAGVLENPRPAMIFAQHIDPDLELGYFSTSPSVAMVATCEFQITIKGTSTHGSTPHKGSDPILVAAEIIHYAQSFLARYNNPFGASVLSICAINGGTVNNAFPEEVKMLGTLRTYLEEKRNQYLELFASKCTQIAELYDTKCDFNKIYGYPPVINNPETVEFVRKSVQQLYGRNEFGSEYFQLTEPKMWAEDFSYYAKEIPACMYFTGINTHNNKEIFPLHSNKLNPNENTLINGTALFASIATNYCK